jgi:GxxExxY protein
MATDPTNKLLDTLLQLAEKVYKQQKAGRPAFIYEAAYIALLKNYRIGFNQTEEPILKFKSSVVGKLNAPLIVEGMIVVEIKALHQPILPPTATLQSNLHYFNLPYGLLFNYSTSQLYIQRVPNASYIAMQVNTALD